MILDIRAQLDNGDYVNIEMQSSAFSKNQYQRFQIYGASLLSRQEKTGDDYKEKIRHVYQIIFIDGIDKNNLKLYDKYESRNEIFENGLTDDIMALKGHKVIEVMKNKIDKFNKDEELRDMAYKRSLNRWANEQDKQDMYEKGIIEKNREKTKQLFKKYYPDENPGILENLNNEQYDKIFEMILDNCSIVEIKNILK